MTRKEEIEKAGLYYANNLDDIKPNDEFSKNLCIALGQAYIEGAEWADNHPKKGLVDIDTVCKVIEEMLPNYVELNYVFDEISVNYHKFKNNFISDFRKTLKQ